MKKYISALLVIVFVMTNFFNLKSYSEGSVFSINLSGYTKPSGVNFQTGPKRQMNYAITLPNVQAVAHVDVTGTKIYLDKRSLNTSAPVLGNFDAGTVHPGVKQASNLQRDMVTSWKSYVLNRYESEPFIPFDDDGNVTGLRNLIGQVSNVPIYYQGKTWVNLDTVNYIFVANKVTIQAEQYLITDQPAKDQFVVDLRLVVRVEYQDFYQLSIWKNTWYNHYGNVVLDKYSVSATKSVINGQVKTDSAVVGDLDVLEDSDELKISLLSYFNRANVTQSTLKYDAPDWSVYRRNPNIYGIAYVPTYLFFIYVKVDPNTKAINLGDVDFVRKLIAPNADLNSTPVISNVVQYKKGEYVLAMPVFNALRLYEDATNKLGLKKSSGLGYDPNDVANRLRQKWKETIKGADARYGLQKIVSQINKDYKASHNVSAVADQLAQQALDNVLNILANDYPQLANWGMEDFGDGRKRIVYGDRLLPANYRPILDRAVADLKDGITNEEDLAIKSLYDQYTTAQDIVDAYFAPMWRNMVVIPFKVKRPDDIEIRIIDTGITPKVNNSAEGSGKREYENLNRNEVSYALPGKTYTAKFEIINNSDHPVTNFVARYYVVSSRPGPGNKPVIYSSGVLGMVFGKTYQFTDPPKVVSAPPGTAKDTATIGGDPPLFDAVASGASSSAGFIDPDKKITGQFQWTMPPTDHPVYLYVTVAKVINENQPMAPNGTGTLSVWEPVFIDEKLGYAPGQGKATFVAYTPNQIMLRNEGPTEAANNHDVVTVAIRFDEPSGGTSGDVPPDQLVEQENFVRNAEVTTYVDQELQVWIEDGYWVPIEEQTFHYKRTQWLVK